jgi:predicted DCC family thiol-disulfide oxidoreductase YuxK
MPESAPVGTEIKDGRHGSMSATLARRPDRTHSAQHSPEDRNWAAGYRFQIFYDGDCPLCRREIEWVRRRDIHRRIMLTDIANSSFDAAEFGKTSNELMAKIHGRFPDGRWTVGPETIRVLYGELGWGWAVQWTGWPVIRHVFDGLYRVFAANRLRLTGRSKCSGSSACDRNTAP